ncbi:MAG: hypothetical protein WD022_05415 [Balneolaceae bacterium]
MYRLGLVSIILSLTIFLSCSNNSTDSDVLDVGEGIGSFTVTGDVEAEREGVSYFTVTRSDGDLLGIRIHIEKAHPLDRDDSYNSDYSFTLLADKDGEPFTLTTGTYEIGLLSDDNLAFAGVYTHRISADVVNGYQSADQGGSITISSSSDEMIQASFEFKAIDYGDGAEEDKVVTISGEFTSKCFGPSC